MQYRVDPKSGNSLSVLGFGCMRLPRNLSQIDMKKSENILLKAIEGGVNYFDAAYLYPGSEGALGAILSKNNAREKVFIATKLPLGKCGSYEDFDRLFEKQLERLQTDYIDYYLMHNLSDRSLWKKLCDIGIETWIAEKKRSGQIRQIGFSFHGMQNEFLSLLDQYPWDFCQIQYNYVNENYQAGRKGLLKAAEMGLPVIVMEPLLGGKLANGLPKRAADLLKGVNSSLSPAAWALRWLWNQKEVTVVLSGMNDDAQITENLAVARESVPGMLSPHEEAAIASVVDTFHEAFKIPCTGCNYCMPCPQNVNIPACFSAYNMSYTVGMFSAIQLYATSTGGFSAQKDYSPGNCVKCGKCEKHCPQHIQITKRLEDVAQRMEPFWYRTVKFAMTRRRAKK